MTDSREHAAALFERQADHCGVLGSPLYATLMRAAADDLRAGGPVADAVRGWETDAERRVLALRLFGAVHRLVLERKAPHLALHYPSVGGTAGPDGAWEAFRDVLVEHHDAVRADLWQVPQTNEIGRSAALVGALRHLVAEADLPVRLHEIGASAGLNLLGDQFRFTTTSGRAYGPADSPVVLSGAWTGAELPDGPPLRVVERAGTDLAPLDACSEQGRLLLTSYVWPDQLARMERLRGALTMAKRLPVTVSAASAREAVDRLELTDGSWTVVWHSVMWQYVGGEEQQAVLDRLEALGATASADRRLAHVSLENGLRGENPEGFALTLRRWPDGEETVLGTAPAHGIPVTWNG